METTTATDDPLSRSPPRRFQFQIRDVVLVTTLLAVLLAGIVQGNLWLLLAFFVAAWFAWWRVPFSSLGKLAAVVVGFLLIGALVVPSISIPRSISRHQSCRNNLRNIAYALHNYHDTYGSFPPAYICDGNGKPMHSWRVLLLPFLEQQGLYSQYRFDEPWDGPNNRRLAPLILNVYGCPTDHEPQRSTETSYVAIVGPGTVWPGEKGARFVDLADGTGNVLLIAEIHNSGIHWMEPRDLHVTQMATTINPRHGQGISSNHQDGAFVLNADGSVRFLKSDTPADALHSLIHASDGTIPLP